MSDNNVILRFSDVGFEYENGKHLLEEVSFSLRTGSRVALMGQNGAGKSTIFKLITGEIEPTSGRVLKTDSGTTIGIAHQVMPKAVLNLTIREYFSAAFSDIKYNLDKLINDVFDVVHLSLSLDKKIGEFSGGQQARLQLAYALIQQPDILLLDEPTNNLDQYGIDHLTGFLMMYEKTCLVISHDAEFLNAFCDGVLYLDAHTKKVEQYSGNYEDVMEDIKNRIERENLQNARMQTQIKEKRSQAEVFAHKGGKLRGVAKRMREAAEDAEENIVEVRREDKTIREFTIPNQEFDPLFDGRIVQFSGISAMKNNEIITKEIDLIVRKDTHLLIAGPNGIGKSTLLQRIVDCEDENIVIAKEVVVGYYKQDFSNLNYDQTAYNTLEEVMEDRDEHILRSTAAGFLLDGKILASQIRSLSEGQKGLLSFCRLVLLKPGLLILDEPTNHINFRHLPIIAKALHKYAGALIMVSHIPYFVEQIHIDKTIDLDTMRVK